MGTHAASVDLALVPLSVPARREWLRLLIFIATGAGAIAMGFAFRQGLWRDVPLSLSVREQAGQLLIGWSRFGASRGAKLEILDGIERTTVLVAAPLYDVTYAARTADVEVRLTRLDDPSQPQIARFVVQEPARPDLQSQFTSLLLEARNLRRRLSRQSRHVTELRAAAETLVSRLPDAALRKSLPKPSKPTTWWR